MCVVCTFMTCDNRRLMKFLSKSLLLIFLGNGNCLLYFFMDKLQLTGQIFSLTCGRARLRHAIAFIQKQPSSNLKTKDLREYIDCSLAPPACLVLVDSYVASHCLAVTPQSSAKQIFYCTVYYMTLNSNCEVQRESKNLKKM